MSKPHTCRAARHQAKEARTRFSNKSSIRRKEVILEILHFAEVVVNHLLHVRDKSMEKGDYWHD